MNDRTEKLLKLLVQRYINDGTPVGSKTLASDSALNISAATVRNIMSELEDLGYLKSPHTSAGRIPTDKAYRLFVNHLIQVKPMAPENFQQDIIKALDPKLTTKELIESASSLVSNLTRLAGVVSAPKRDTTRLKHIEFLALSDQRILTVLVLNNREVQNRIIQTDRSFQTSELQQAANYLNHHFAGKTLIDIREQLLGELKTQKAELNDAIHAALNLAEQSFDTEQHSDYIVSGESNLLDISNPETLSDLKSLLDAFAEKKAISHLFSRCLEADDVQIFIGRESGHDVFQDWSIVTSPYYANGDIVGVLGVIGPQRMAYDQVISVVDVTAKLLTATLKE